MLNLQDRNWRAFAIEELFTISSGKRLESRNKTPGDRPFAGAVDNTNGISGFVGNENSSIDHNVLGVNYNGSVGLCFYHPYEIIFSDDVKRFHLISGNDNEQIMLFLKVAIEQQRAKFNYGYKFNAARMKCQRIMLPIDMHGEPDWKFMESYIREREVAQTKHCSDFLAKKIASIERERESRQPASCLSSWPKKEWKAYKLSQIGVIQSGRDIYACDRTDGPVPYITSGSQHNGIGYFVGNENETLDSGYIALNRNGAVGKAFYHPYRSLMGNDCRKLHVKAADGNAYIGNFLAYCISRQRECFSYSRKLGTERAKALSIMLPSSENGDPDYAYMESCGREITLSIIKRLETYLDSQVTD